MKKIAYIELDTHAEIARNFLELMKDSKIFSVDYYFSEKISNQIYNKLSNVHVTESSAILNQLKDKNYDLVVIGTVHRYFHVYEAISREFNTAMIVHNLNFLRSSKSQLFLNIFKNDFAYRLKLLLKEGLLFAPNLFKNAKNLLVLDESLINENKNLKLKFLPVFHHETQEKKASEILTLVIPGTVSQQRRDYLHVLKTLKTFKSSTKYQVVFLGKAAEKELSWLKEFDTIKPENISIRYFTEKVSSDIFNDWMQKADVLWCPIQNETNFFSLKEFYGKTKMSGNVGDAIRYGKPAVFPQTYPTSWSFIDAEESNVEEQIKRMKSKSPNDFLEFKKEKVLEELEKSLLRLL